MKPYEFGDKEYKELSEKIHRLFTTKRLMDFDEINASSEQKSIRQLYNQIDTLARAAFIRVFEHIWGQIVEEEEEEEDLATENGMWLTPEGLVTSDNTVTPQGLHGQTVPIIRERFDSKKSVDAFLASVSPTMKFIWDAEIKRKADRLFESIMADSAKGKREERRKDYDTAEKYILRQIKQYMIDTEDEAVKTVYEVNKEKYVQWITQGDERVCAECSDRDMAVYEIRKVPAKHFNCRCYLRAVRLNY